MPETPRNPLSCTRCKVKKIKCGREEPVCDKCSATKAECNYPIRRKKARSAKKRADILSQILQRLDNLEKKAGVSPQRLLHQPGATASQDGTNASFIGDDDDDTTDSETTHTDNETPFKSLYQLMDEAATTTKDVFESAPEETPSDQGTDALFSNALASIKSFRWKDSRSDDVPDRPEIPDDVALKWINLCFQLTFYEEMIGAANKPLMMAMPNIMKSPDVHVHYSVIVVYYIVLFCGWRSDEKCLTTQWRDYGRKIYRMCLKILPTWKNDGLPSTTMDFIGTGLMSILAIENFDYHLAWELHLACCGIARELKLDKLDDPNPDNRPKGYENEADKNSMRKKFWELIHMEFFFRLYYDKPATMTGANFSVNMPMFEASSTSKHTDDTIYFLVTSRNVFITKEFFDALEKPGQDLKARVDVLTNKMEDLLLEWNIANEIADPSFSMKDKWIYADLIVNAYITIILMERKAATNKDEAKNPSTKSVYAARKTLETIKHLFALFSYQSPNFLNFISFYPFVAFFTLYHHILYRLRQQQKPNLKQLEEIEGDISLMENLAAVLEQLAVTQEEFLLVSNAVTALTRASRQVLSTSLPNTPASAGQTPTGSHNLRNRQGKSVDLGIPEMSSMQTDLTFPWTSADGSDMPQFEAGSTQGGLQSQLFYVESMENGLFGRNWHQNWWDQ